MTMKRPFEFKVTPETVKTGKHWVSVHLKNISTDDMSQLDVKLHSEDPYFLDVLGTGSYVSEIKAGEERVLPFQLNADISTKVYAMVSGFREGEYFFWTSPRVEIDVGVTRAKLRNVFALTHPHAILDETIEAEAVVEGVIGGADFTVSFWHDSPSSYEKIGETKIESLEAGEVIRPSIEFTPEESGIHDIYVYLYHDTKYIGSDSDTIWIE